MYVSVILVQINARRKECTCRKVPLLSVQTPFKNLFKTKVFVQLITERTGRVVRVFTNQQGFLLNSAHEKLTY